MGCLENDDLENDDLENDDLKKTPRGGREGLIEVCECPIPGQKQTSIFIANLPPPPPPPPHELNGRPLILSNVPNTHGNRSYLLWMMLRLQLPRQKGSA